MSIFGLEAPTPSPIRAAGGIFGATLAPGPKPDERPKPKPIEAPLIVEDGEHVLRGLACPTNVATYRDYAWLSFDEHAFDDVLKSPQLDVHIILGHDGASVPLARTRNGTARFWMEKDGLHGEYVLARHPLADSVYEAVRRGDLSGQSISYTHNPSDKVRSDRRGPDGKPLYVITRVRKLFECSILWAPQFVETSIYAVPKRSTKTTSKGDDYFTPAAMRRRLAAMGA